MSFHDRLTTITKKFIRQSIKASESNSPIEISNNSLKTLLNLKRAIYFRNSGYTSSKICRGFRDKVQNRPTPQATPTNLIFNENVTFFEPKNTGQNYQYNKVPYVEATRRLSTSTSRCGLKNEKPRLTRSKKSYSNSDIELGNECLRSDRVIPIEPTNLVQNSASNSNFFSFYENVNFNSFQKDDERSYCQEDSKQEQFPVQLDQNGIPKFEPIKELLDDGNLNFSMTQAGKLTLNDTSSLELEPIETKSLDHITISDIDIPLDIDEMSMCDDVFDETELATLNLSEIDQTLS